MARYSSRKEFRDLSMRLKAPNCSILQLESGRIPAISNPGVILILQLYCPTAECWLSVVFIQAPLVRLFQSPRPIVVRHGAWSTTGSLVTARGRHTATLLPNGKVLVAGGKTFTNSLASTELYDPATGIWTTSGSMATARDIHTATLLGNGTVLVAGGSSTSNSSSFSLLTSAELYDPQSGTWTATGRLANRRVFHTATLLPSGKVLVAGGFSSNGGALASAELYEPATGTWTATGSLVTARWFHTATLLSNGTVLVAAGRIRHR